MCNKWRILHRPLDMNIDFAEYIVKAICVLHNYVRIRDGHSYEDTFFTPPLENLAGEVVGGRAIRVGDVQTKFMDYFNNEESVEWQNRMI